MFWLVLRVLVGVNALLMDINLFDKERVLVH